MKNQKPKSNALCPYAKKCGGCAYLNLSYEEQVQKKKKMVADLLKPFGKVDEMITMEKPQHYRHKVHAVFSRDKGQILAGTYEKKSHKVVDVESCYIDNEKADAIIRTVKDMLPSFKIKAYDEDKDYGLLRHVMVRVGHFTGEIMVVLVLTSPILPYKNDFVKVLRKKHPEITTVVLNVNDKRTSMVLGSRNITLYGKGYIVDKILGKSFRISPTAFYQVNPVQTEKLYARAIEYAGLTGKEVVLDAYSGTGTIGIAMSDQAKEVLSVELNREAVKDAIANAKHNQVKNVRFVAADAGDFMVQMAEEKQHLDVLVMDPPRSGASEAFLNATLQLAPSRIVYVSCGPDTLARDLKVLTKGGYRLKKCTIVEMFPWTEHAETVCLLSNTPEKA